jgi:hypothetical protein
MFNHFDPRNENDYNYYVRCIDRFKNLLQKQEHKLFVMIMINNNDHMNDTIKTNIIEFNTKFSKYTSNYTLLFIFHIANKQQNHHFTYIDNIHFLELHTLSTSCGVQFNNNDNLYLDNIIKTQYNFNLKN